ncbi:MAG: hypothetical protein KTR24_03810 [Saprospiraceae bacterium]|nr:hypothetical protein [Saprospiraceae bacterium]
MKSFTCFLLMLCSTSLVAQYTISQNSGKLKIIEVNEVTLEGHAGSDIIIEVEGEESHIPERAKGLKLLSPAGLEDNTGIGLSVTKDGTTSTIQEVSNRSDERYIIKVPTGVAIYYECSTHQGETLIAQDIASELEVSANFNDVRIINPTGPLAISTVHGSIEAEFENVNQDNSISLHAVHDHVDVTVPSSAKANFMLSTSWGEMFTDLDLDFGHDDSDMRRVSSNKMVGKFNGGGVDFSIRSTHDDIYLRKK